MENKVVNNHAEVTGKAYSEPVFSHEIYGEKFYTFTLEIPRLSGTSDFVQVMVSERLLPDCPIIVGSIYSLSGQFRSYNSTQGDARLVLTVFAKDICPCDTADKNPNSLFLNGFVCKTPVYRTTPFGREITDLLLAVNRSYNKSDYIPVIAWGRNARFARNIMVGDNVKVWGRIQSRVYQKHISEDDVVERTAYEVSVNRMEFA